MKTLFETMVQEIRDKTKRFKEIEQEEIFNQELIKPEKERDIDVIRLFTKQILRTNEELLQLNEDIVKYANNQSSLQVIFKLGELYTSHINQCHDLTKSLVRKSNQEDNDKKLKEIDEVREFLKAQGLELPSQLTDMIDRVKEVYNKSKGH